MLAIREKIILLIGSGSVAATNLPGLTHLLKDEFDMPIVVILTENAKRFVTKDALNYLGYAKIVLEDSKENYFEIPDHIWLSQNAKGVIVYPASAGFIGKVANGLALDLASTTMLCCNDLPILIVPSMNEVMWDNPFLQENILKLENNGFHISATNKGTAPDVYSVKDRFKEVLQTHKLSKAI